MQYYCFAKHVNKTLRWNVRTFIVNQYSVETSHGSCLRAAADTTCSGSMVSEEINGQAKKNKCISAAARGQIMRHNTWGSFIGRLRTDVSDLERVRDFCDEIKYPIGSLIPKQNYVRAKALFHALLLKSNALLHGKYLSKHDQSNDRAARNYALFEKDADIDSIADTVNSALRLLLRICREPWSRVESGQAHHSCVQFSKPSYTNLLFKTWKNAALRNENVLSAIKVTQLLQQISSKGRFRYDFATIGMVLQVALQQTPKRVAPEVVWYIWDTLELQEMCPCRISSKVASKHVLYFYNTSLKAHAESGNDIDDVLRNMYDLMDDMRHRRNINPDTISYNILLRFIGRNDLRLETFEFAFRMMKLEKVFPDLATLFEAVSCYTKFEQLNRSEEYFQQMLDALASASTPDSLDCDRKSQSNVGLVAHASKGVMNLYLTSFLKCKTASGRRKIVDSAQALFLDLDRQNFGSMSSARTYIVNSVSAHLGNSYSQMSTSITVSNYGISRVSFSYHHGDVRPKWDAQSSEIDIATDEKPLRGSLQIYDSVVRQSG
jgi:ASC-1-like (ASCH) protein